MIRSIFYSDCNQIAKIEAKTFGTILDEHRLLALLENPFFFGFVDDLKETDVAFGRPPLLAGYLLANIVVDEAEILSIAVSPDYRNLGKGTNLLQHFNAFIAAKDVKTVFLEVAADNKEALTLYRAQGFSEFSRRLAYYKRIDNRCDAVKMKLQVK